MKNYYEHVAELNIAKERLECKVKQKENLYNKYFNTTSKIKDIIVRNNAIEDKMTEYLIELEETGLSQEIERLQNEIRELEYHKRKMECIIKECKEKNEIRKLIVYLRDYQGLKWSDIQKFVNYSERQIFRIYKGD